MKSSLEKYRKITRQNKRRKENKRKTNDKKYKNKRRTRIIGEKGKEEE
jgi:hypothetical protein